MVASWKVNFVFLSAKLHFKLHSWSNEGTHVSDNCSPVSWLEKLLSVLSSAGLHQCTSAPWTAYTPPVRYFMMLGWIPSINSLYNSFGRQKQSDYSLSRVVTFFTITGGALVPTAQQKGKADSLPPVVNTTFIPLEMAICAYTHFQNKRTYF